MQIKILGTRGEISATHPKHSKHSGILIDDKLLLDVGEKEFLKYRPEFIFITHLHPDHAFFMAPGEKIEPTGLLYAPERSERLSEANIVRNAVAVDGYKITPVPVIHSVKVKSLGYLVEKKDKRIFYTGDIASIQKQYLARLTKLDLVITEASFLRKGGLIRKNERGDVFGHAGVPDLVNLFCKSTKRIVFIHFGTWFLRDISSGIQRIKSLETNDLKIEVASDGSEYRI